MVWYFVTNVLWQRPASSGAASHPQTLSWNFLQALSSSLLDLLLFGSFPWWCTINLIFRACVDWKSFSHLLHAIFEGFSCWWKSGRGLLLAHLLTLSSSQAALPVTIYLIFFFKTDVLLLSICRASVQRWMFAKLNQIWRSLSHQYPRSHHAAELCNLVLFLAWYLVYW